MNVAQSLPSNADPVAGIIADFNLRTPGSKRMSAENRRVLADKSSIGLAFSNEIKEACYPIVAEHAEGAYLRDVDGNRYVDILMGLGTSLFGHNPPFIREAIEARLAQGFPIGPQSELAGETAGLFCQLTGMDRVTFSNTGSEAVMTAIRLARTATRRDRIAFFTSSYHGHFDAALSRATALEYYRKGALRRAASSAPFRLARPLLERLMFTRGHPSALGIPKAASRDVLMLDYGNPRSLDVLRRKGSRIAAVIVEPVQTRCPEIQPRDFLHELRRITEASGTALVFDEMVTGFRVHPGGAQAHFGVQADLATYSKIAGGGLPLSVIAGRHRFMNHLDGGEWSFGDDSGPSTPTTFFAGTFCRHPLSLSAARATARHLLAEGPSLQEGLNARTADLVCRLNADARSDGLPVTFTGFGSFFAMALSQSAITPLALNLLSFLLLTRGVHLRGGDRGGFLSTAHSDADIDAVRVAFSEGLRTLADLGLLNRNDRSVRS
ncbi:aspartate aminotransferase family protein [Marinivivus vitaminiproducens]|uniref:aspartate aminotransferase family protein n=1 Tax=Marinivivus vitaminiproducens TaxID=3035935 RepID=UPI0027A8109A|nr:aminotransferase class III-fold pyridoxal phosphate-dependent enzyme [Geminicoccaceae bacterium SCSIO 64248]